MIQSPGSQRMVPSRVGISTATFIRMAWMTTGFFRKPFQLSEDIPGPEQSSWGHSNQGWASQIMSGTINTPLRSYPEHRASRRPHSLESGFVAPYDDGGTAATGSLSNTPWPLHNP